MGEGGHPAKRVQFFGVLYIGVNPAIGFYICNCREIGAHPAAFSFKCVALAASFLEKKFFAAVRHGTAGNERGYRDN